MSPRPHYAEERRLGRWHPVRYPGTPDVHKGRLRSANGLGPEIRAVQEIPIGLGAHTLDQLVPIFGTEDVRLQHRADDRALESHPIQ